MSDKDGPEDTGQETGYIHDTDMALSPLTNTTFIMTLTNILRKNEREFTSATKSIITFLAKYIMNMNHIFILSINLTGIIDKKGTLGGGLQ